MWRVAICVVLGTASAAADSPPCLPAGTPALSTMADTGDTLACVSDGKKSTCLQVAPNAAPKPAKAPFASLIGTWSPIHQDKGAWVKCEYDGKCKPLAKPIVDALEAAKAEHGDYPAIEVSNDQRTIVLGNRRVFVDANGTKELTLAPPREYRLPRKDKPVPALFELELVGNTLVAEWSDCAGPCAKAVVVDRKGKNGPWFTAGIEVSMDAKRFFVFPTNDDAFVSLVDGSTGRVIAKSRLTSKGALTSMAAIRTDKHAVALWLDYDDKWKLGHFSIGRGIAQKLISIARCP